MPVGIITDEELNKEITGSVKNQEKPGRRPGDNNVPDSLRKVISEESITNGRKAALELANMFGISPASVSAYANDATSTSTYDKPNAELKKRNKEVRQSVTETAQGKLILALDSITPEKLAEAGLKTVSAVARDMSAIVKNMDEDSNTRDAVAATQPLILYMPQVNMENQYQILQVNE